MVIPMDGMDNILDPAQILRQTAWLKSLASSLLADDARAEDVVQDTWLAFLKHPPQNPRATTSWLRSVVRKLAFSNYRSESRRERHEHIAARPEGATITPAEILERIDLQRQLVELVSGLEEPYRTTILLRFFENLRPREIARRQEVPVTTVRGRIHKALGILRTRLDRAHGGDRSAWLGALLPLTGLKAPAPFIAAPAVSAVGASATSGSSTGLPTLVLGGILMTKKIALSWGLVFLIVVGAGVGLWKVTPRQPQGDPHTPSWTGEYREFASRLERVQGELKKVQADRDALALANRSLQEELKSLGHSESPPTDTSKEEKPTGTAGGSGINWSDLSGLLAKDIGLLEKSQRSESLSEEEEAQRRWLFAELQKTSAKAKSLTQYPFFDRQTFDELTLAFFKDSLRLTEDQLSLLHQLNDGIFADVPEDVDALSSLDRHRLRQEMVARFSKGMEGILADDQTKDWTTLHQFAEDVFEYGGRLELGASTPPRSLLVNWITNALNEQATPSLLDPLTPVAENYIRGASGLIDRYLPGGADPKTLSPQDRVELEKQMLDLQERFHDEVQPFLSEEQRKKFHDKPPLIIRFVPGNGVSVRGQWNLF